VPTTLSPPLTCVVLVSLGRSSSAAACTMAQHSGTVSIRATAIRLPFSAPCVRLARLACPLRPRQGRGRVRRSLPTFRVCDGAHIRFVDGKAESGTRPFSCSRRGGDCVGAAAMDLYGALLFQITGQQLSVRRPAGPWPASRLCSAATSLHPPSCWERRRANSARPGSRGARSARFATSPGGYRTAAWTRTC